MTHAVPPLTPLRLALSLNLRASSPEALLAALDRVRDQVRSGATTLQERGEHSAYDFDLSDQPGGFGRLLVIAHDGYHGNAWLVVADERAVAAEYDDEHEAYGVGVRCLKRGGSVMVAHFTAAQPDPPDRERLQRAAEHLAAQLYTHPGQVPNGWTVSERFGPGDLNRFIDTQADQ